MTNALRKVLALLVAPIALFGLVFSISTTAANADGATQQPASGEQGIASQATEISTDVRPWCGWTALTGANDSITLVPAADQDAVYDGDKIDLVAQGQQFAIKVGPAEEAVAAGSEFDPELTDNCSWFDDSEKNAVSVKTTLNSVSFAGRSNANAEAVTDDSMSFEADISNPFAVANVAMNCTGFTFGTSLSVTDIGSAGTGVEVVSMAVGAVNTNNFCSWTSDYSISIPAGKKPLFGDSTYTYVGPTITNTMVYSRS
jgi:hypothetical protein